MRGPVLIDWYSVVRRELVLSSRLYVQVARYVHEIQLNFPPSYVSLPEHAKLKENASVGLYHIKVVESELRTDQLSLELRGSCNGE